MRIISTSSDIKCHNWQEGTLHSSYKPTSTSTHINTVSWAKDNGWIVLVPNQGHAEIVSFNESPKSLLTIKEVQHPTSACFPNTTKRNIALATSTGQIMIYDIKKREVKKKFPYAPSTFFKLEYTTGDKYIIAGCQNGVVYMYNSVSSNLCGSFKVPKSRTLTNFRCHPVKSSYVSACSEEGIVCVWDLNRSKSLINVEAHKLPATDLAFVSYNFELLASLGMDRNVSLFDFRSNKTVHSGILKKSPTTIDCSSDGQCIAIGYQDGQIDSFDLRNMNETVLKFKHSEKVTNIIFEKSLVNNGSEFSLQDEAVLEVEEKTKDSFGQMVFGSPLQEIPEITTEECNEKELKDSFFDALGFSITNSVGKQASRRRISDGVRKLIDSKPNFFQASPSNANFNSIDYKTSIGKNQMFQASPSNTIDSKNSNAKSQVEHLSSKSNLISTPVLTSDKNFPAFQVSPIASKKPGLEDAAEIKDIVQQVVREELEEFKKEVKFQIMDMMQASTRLFFDLQMSQMKEFIALGDKLDKLREDLECGDCTDSGYGCP